MNTSTSKEVLGMRIEKIVQEHIAACHLEAEAALQRAFSTAKLPTKPTPARKPAAKSRVYRTPEEVAALGDRFYQALCDSPGRTTAALAKTIDVTSLELRAPLARLKQAGRIRSVGQRQHTRYFPSVDKT